MLAGVGGCVKPERLHAPRFYHESEGGAMVEVKVSFTYAGHGCQARLSGTDVAAALGELRRLLCALGVKANDAGEVEALPVLVGCCPSCGAVGVRFVFGGSQPWADNGAPDLQLWGCPNCGTTLATGAVVGACSPRMEV